MTAERPTRPERSACARRLLAPALALGMGLAGAARVLGHPGMHETIERLSQQLAAAPNDQRLHIERGVAYSNDGNAAAALADFRRAELLGDPDLVAFDLGVLFYRSGDYAAARAQLTRSLARFPNDARALDYRARAAREAGDARAALADLEALFALHGDVNPGHYLSAAELLAAQPDEGLPAALALLDRGIRALGVIPQLQQRAIAYERARGDSAAALRRLDTLADPLGRNPEWRTERAELLLALGRRDEAARELEDATAALAALKRTPARAALLVRAQSLQRRASEMEASGDAPGLTPARAR